jgi:hypothetical protein
VPVSQGSLGRTGVDLRAGLGDPETGIGQMQLAVAMEGRLEAPAGDHTDRQIPIGTEPAAQLRKTERIRRSQAGIEIEHEQAVGGRGVHSRGGETRRVTPVAEPEGRALTSGGEAALPRRAEVVGPHGHPS